MRFEVRLLSMNLISRLVGQHRLLLLPLYSYLQRYLNAHQANVTQVRCAASAPQLHVWCYYYSITYACGVACRCWRT
jgi:protein SDA1